MTMYLDIITKEGKRGKVPLEDEAIQTYIMALEFRIKHPELSKLHKTYPDRFDPPKEKFYKNAYHIIKAFALLGDVYTDRIPLKSNDGNRLNEHDALVKFLDYAEKARGCLVKWNSLKT